MTPNSDSQHAEDLSVVRRVIRARATQKLLGDPANPVVFDATTAHRHDELVTAAVLDAGWAPFHFDRGVDAIREPWRATLIDHRSCRAVMANLPQWTDQPLGKIPSMLAACGAAVVVTWLPQFRGAAPDAANQAGSDQEKARRIDDEHLAASSAMVQNLLLLLTAAGFGTYWSSGGAAMRDPDVLTHLSIPSEETLLALVFVEYPTEAPDLTRVPGKHRDHRSDAWLRRVTVTTPG